MSIVGVLIGSCAALTLAFGLSKAHSTPEMTSTLLIGGGRIDVTIESGDMKLTQPEVLHWVQLAAEAVATYYGKYPVPHLTLRIQPFEGHGVNHGMTWGRGGGLIKIGLGSDTTAAELANDWMLTHEMVHLSFPSLPDENHWMEEGLATYVEPIARIQAKQMEASSMWADLAHDMPKGVPRADDTGLDHTHTWASTYWGGALFCFLADVEIRERTHNQMGLQDALRAILKSGGDINADWKIEDVFKAGDKATGVPVLTELYAKMKDQPMPVDLADLWKRLGIEPDGKTVRFSEDAPLAAIRKSITNPDTAATHQSYREAPPVTVFAGRTVSSPKSL